MRTISFLITVIILTVSAGPALPQDDFAPWDFNNGKAVPAQAGDQGEMSVGAKALYWGVRFYQETASRVNGERCQMYPSCSAYSLEAIRKHGFFLGYMMTVDRLLHESDEMDSAPIIKLNNGKEKYFDPVEANDFWWYGK